jgi:hypothetical protein
MQILRRENHYSLGYDALSQLKQVSAGFNLWLKPLRETALAETLSTLETENINHWECVITNSDEGVQNNG